MAEIKLLYYNSFCCQNQFAVCSKTVFFWIGIWNKLKPFIFSFGQICKQTHNVYPYTSDKYIQKNNSLRCVRISNTSNILNTVLEYLFLHQCLWRFYTERKSDLVYSMDTFDTFLRFSKTASTNFCMKKFRCAIVFSRASVIQFYIQWRTCFFCEKLFMKIF